MTICSVIILLITMVARPFASLTVFAALDHLIFVVAKRAVVPTIAIGALMVGIAFFRNDRNGGVVIPLSPAGRMPLPV